MMISNLKNLSLLSIILLWSMLFAACHHGSGRAIEYTVSGTVSGLSGTLVLQNNGVDDLTLTADGAFTFATALVDGSAYDVTVLTQPVGQICTITAGSGTLAGADVPGAAAGWVDTPPLFLRGES